MDKNEICLFGVHLYDDHHIFSFFYTQKFSATSVFPLGFRLPKYSDLLPFENFFLEGQVRYTYFTDVAAGPLRVGCKILKRNMRFSLPRYEGFYGPTHLNKTKLLPVSKLRPPLSFRCCHCWPTAGRLDRHTSAAAAAAASAFLPKTPLKLCKW